MDFMMFFGGVIGFTVGIIMLIVSFAKHKPKKPSLIVLGVSVAIIFLALVLAVVSGDSSGSGSSGGGNGQTKGNIKALEFSYGQDDEITLKVGATKGNSHVDASVRNSSSFKPEDVIFVSDDPSVATIEFEKAALTTYLYYTIKAVGPGTTEVYAKSSDGSVESKHIKVIVPEPIKIQSLSIDLAKTDFVLGESSTAKVIISPENAEDRRLTWDSSDTSIATVDEKGTIYAIGGGEAVITVKSADGVSASANISVDGSKHLMKLKTTSRRDDSNNIGDEWWKDFEVNGERAPIQIGVAVGENLVLHVRIQESDENPDVGEATIYHTVTDEDLVNGFSETMEVYVTENGGRNSGMSAHFIVTFEFSPM